MKGSQRKGVPGSLMSSPPAEGGNLGSETKRHLRAAWPQISDSNARHASAPSTV